MTSRSAVQLLRYGLVGLASNLTGYFIYLLITYIGMEPKRAMSVLYIVGAVIGFFGNRRWAFAHKGALLAAGGRYSLAHLAGYLINLVVLLLFVDVLGYPHQLVQAAAIVGVAGFLFVVFKHFVFPESAGVDRGGQ